MSTLIARIQSAPIFEYGDIAGLCDALLCEFGEGDLMSANEIIATLEELLDETIIDEMGARKLPVHHSPPWAKKPEG